MAETKTNVVVLGAGVIGLTTAMLLSKNPKISITIVAKHMPGDYDIEYASPWAGANFFPFSKEGTPEYIYERDTWAPLSDLATHHPEAGVHFQDAVLYNRAKDAPNPSKPGPLSQLQRLDPWYSSLVPNFRILSPSELPAGIASGTTFTSVCINTALYLPYLTSQCLAAGCVLKRGIATHITSAASLHSSGTPASIIINCTGLGSLSLPGVSDTSLYPIRGQIVLVRNDPGVMLGLSGTDDGPDELTYIMHRAAGGGTVLGGCYQIGATESTPDFNLANRIMSRAVRICPRLVGEGRGVEGLSVVRHGVGLRPGRKGGVRVEREWVEFPEVEGTEAVEEGTEAVEEGTEAVEEGTEAVEEGTEAVEEGTEAVKEGTEAVEEGTEAAEEETEADSQPNVTKLQQNSKQVKSTASSTTSDLLSVHKHSLNSINSSINNESTTTTTTTTNTTAAPSENQNAQNAQTGIWVIHHYGHGGAGYQSSYGSAAVAVGLVEGVVAEGAEEPS